MKGAILQILILCAVIVVGYLAFDWRQPVVPVQEAPEKPAVSPEEHLPSIEKPSEKKGTPTFTLLLDNKKTNYFGILGETRGQDFEEDPINSTVLNQLFLQLKIRNVKALFLSGNIVSGIIQEGKKKTKPISDQKLSKDLQHFFELYKSIFEGGTPLYPAMGGREVMIKNGAKQFIEQFHLYGARVVDNQLLYTVSAGDAFFAIIGTDEIIDGSEKSQEAFSDSMLKWLSEVLAEGAKTHKYLFVVGFEPAFPSTTTFSKGHLPQRDAFWKILVQNKVLAYFSSKEHLFDRSNRNGVWQIISGGGGAPLSQGGGSHPFFHALVLSLPGTEDEGDDKVKGKGRKNIKADFPSIQVIDTDGNVIEEFSLSRENQPLYQMRIS
jgi:hypothetical protein